ncbi:MAG TPA: hypothetical protein VI895_10930 [Bdellovibrionota bacterium]|nr:hypothetical protein [Bdellovibrionota bacterium]
MKLKKARIVVRSIDQVKKEWKAALKGKLRSIQSRNEVVFLSLNSIAKLLTRARLQLMAAILKGKPKSIYALAKMVHRDFKNVHSDVLLLSELGFIELKSQGQREAITPVAKYSGFEVNLAA